MLSKSRPSAAMYRVVPEIARRRRAGSAEDFHVFLLGSEEAPSLIERRARALVTKEMKAEGA
jgi:hypothetical protein